ncbi:MAG TPA: GntR family transcriptional regulator [Candidatus Cloacimonetes bacterium]|nr:GntR family transcriptional regulator [Candidatus Cloacimonadota bacterium]
MSIFKDDIPIYLQLRQKIEEQILDGALKEGDKLQSLRLMSAQYRINPITAGNAVNALVDEGILFQKRGIGVFVSEGARELIIKNRYKNFKKDTLEPALRLAKSYEMPQIELMNLILRIYGENDEQDD